MRYLVIGTLIAASVSLQACAIDAGGEQTASSGSAVTVLSPFAQIAGGQGHTCAITSAGAVKCWGYNSYGELGDGTATERKNPVAVVGLSSGATSVAASTHHSCATTSTGIQCWGTNVWGELGDGTGVSSIVPVTVAGISLARQVVAGEFHTCAIVLANAGDTSGGVQCWGINNSGQLGIGGSPTPSYQLSPTPVVGLSSGVTLLAAGAYHTCALTTAGAVFCWGDSDEGQIGDGSTTPSSRTTPVAVPSLSSGVIGITAGDYHTCAITTAGAASCWGANGNGQLGDGTLVSESAPVGVSGLASKVTNITGGGQHTCAILNTGAAKCWGENASGQTGDGEAFPSGHKTLPPVKKPAAVVGFASGTTSIGGGYQHTCGFSGGTLQCWGDNQYGELGNGGLTQTSSPVSVVGF